MGRRISFIDSIKGFAILTVVLGHVIQGFYEADLFQESRNFMSIAINIIYSFHMPLFFIVSGFLLYYAYLQKNRLKPFIKQIINIPILYFFYSIILWIFKFIFSKNTNFPVSVKDLLRIPIRAIYPYWYLYVLFFYYVAFGFLYFWLNKNGKQKYFKYFGIAALVITLISPFIKTSILELGKMSYYSAFFFAGILLGEFITAFDNKVLNLILLLSGFTVGMIIYIAYFGEAYQYIDYINTLVAFSTCSVIIVLFKNIKFLDNKLFRLFGEYCLEVYIIHSFFTAGFRVLFVKIGLTSFPVALIVNLVLSSVFPILISMLLKKLKLHTLFFRPVDLILK